MEKLKMLRCALLKPVRNHPTPLLSLSSSSSFASKRISGAVRGGLRKLTTLSNQSDHTRIMEEVIDQHTEEETGDVMYHSFGEVYATRCEDEGFGVIYGEKQTLIRGDKDMDDVDSKTGQQNMRQKEQTKEEKAKG